MMQQRRPETSSGLGRFIFYPLVAGLGGAALGGIVQIPFANHPIIDMGLDGFIGSLVGAGAAIGHNYWINRND